MDAILTNLGRPSILVVLAGLLPALVALQLFRTYWRLKYIPGPILSSITNIPRVRWLKTKKAHLIHQKLHEQYGPIVRTGPNMVMFNDPAEIPIVHTMRKGFPKVRWWFPSAVIQEVWES
jgi:hypothetical protein